MTDDLLAFSFFVGIVGLAVGICVLIDRSRSVQTSAKTSARTTVEVAEKKSSSYDLFKYALYFALCNALYSAYQKSQQPPDRPVVNAAAQKVRQDPTRAGVATRPSAAYSGK